MAESSPPPSTDRTWQSTPIAFKNAGAKPYTSTLHLLPAPEKYRRLVAEMKTRFVGPMPVAEFLQDFVPVPKDDKEQALTRPAFPAFEATTKSSEDKFIAAIEASGLCPNLRFLNTTTTADEEHVEKLKPDISVIVADETGIPRWRKMELTIERKPKNHDPFVDPSPLEARFDNHEKIFPHVSSDDARKALGQIASYAHAQFTAEFRTACFSVVLMEDYGRLLRWDRSGTTVTERFNWVNDPDTLAEFLWRFDKLSQTDRGYDTTVSEPTEDECTLTRTAFREARAMGKKHDYLPVLKDDTELHKFEVYDEATQKTCFFVGPSAHIYSHSLTGRGTFGHYVLALHSGGGIMYLKDSWRIDIPEMEKEVNIYARLSAAGVRRIAELACGGDVPDQSTLTQDYVDKNWACDSSNVFKHSHCRLVLKTIGQPLERFTSTRQLCKAISDALTAHTDAYEKCHILHRDVSAGNILIDEEGRGFLIDWDLSKDVRQTGGPRRRWRTGTWQFISAAILQDPLHKNHELSDDLESFCHVLTFHIVKFRPTGILLLDTKINDVFDQFSERPGGEITGGNGKVHFFGGSNLPVWDLENSIPAPCLDIIEGLREFFSPLYIRRRGASKPLVINSASPVQKIFDDCLDKSRNEEWLDNDGPAVYVAGAYPFISAATASKPKRKRPISDAGPISLHPSARKALRQSKPSSAQDDVFTVVEEDESGSIGSETEA